MCEAEGFGGLSSKKDLLAVGLMSGTSMDGVDAALVRLKTARNDPDPKLMAFHTRPYTGEQRDALMETASGHQCTAEEVATLNTGVAVAFADSFFAVCKKAGVKPGSVDFIGSHGQTVAHVPPGDGDKLMTGTLQLGSPGMIAALTGVTTVGDFRSGDMALGGQGAPLVPYADYLLLRSRRSSRCILNIGGIANITYLPRGGGIEETAAFDTGPGNMVSDAIFRGLYPGSGEFDALGIKAGSGRAKESLVEKFLEMPFFSKQPPKSAGHSEFGAHFAWDFLARAREADMNREDTLASSLHLTVRSIALSIDRFIKPLGDIDEIFVSGGGARNTALIELLGRTLAPIEVGTVDDLGVSAEAKEAIDFAVLARETLFFRTNVISRVTGASKALVLGIIAPGSEK